MTNPPDAGFGAVLRPALPIAAALAVVASTFGLVSWAPWQTAPPEAVHECSAIGDATAPRTSAPSGFYPSTFRLALAAPDGDDIIYTLDGSYPDLDDNLDATDTYREPIRVLDRSGQTPTLASIPSAVNRHHLGDLSQGGSPADTVDHSWQTPLEGAQIQRATVVRARTLDSDAECSAVYFVGSALGRPDLPVLHLATDPDHLFDHFDGIYVPGDVYERYIEEIGEDYDGRFWTMPGNFNRRGREWERPAENDLERSTIMHHFQPGGEFSRSWNLGVRIHGGATRHFPQKSLRLYARNDYGQRSFDFPFFGDDAPEAQRRLMLRNSGNDWQWTMLLDGYVQSLVSHLDLETQAYQPAVLFLNGEYWGIHNLRERYDRHYLEMQHGVDPDNVSILELDSGSCCAVDTGPEEEADRFVAWLGELAEDTTPDDEVAAAVARVVDLEDFTDYLILQTFLSNRDWPQTNLSFWRQVVEPSSDGHAGDGRWRWLTFDLDYLGGEFSNFGASQRNLEHDQIERLLEQFDVDDPSHWGGVPWLFGRLSEDPVWRDTYLSRFADLLNTAFDPDRTNDQLRTMAAVIEDEIEHHAARWGWTGEQAGWHSVTSVADWREEIGLLGRFMRDRPAVQRQQLVDHFDLDGTVDVERVHHTDLGHVRVNTIDLDPSTPGVLDAGAWTAIYFAGIPITVHAEPADGATFVRWEGLPDDADPDRATVTFVPDGDVRIEAVFETE